MELKFSVSGVPFIEFDDDKADDFEVKYKVRLSFVKLTNADIIYKYVSVKGYRSTISAKRKINIIERENFIADVTLNGFPNGFTGDECHNFTKHKHSFLKKVMKKYVVGEGDSAYLPADPKILKKISKDVAAYKEPKRRLKKKVKKVRRSVVYLTDEAIAEKKAKKEADEKKKADKEKKAEEKKLNKRKNEIEKLEKEINGKKKKRKPKRVKKANPTKTVELSKTCKSCGKELFTVPSCNSSMIIGHNKRWMPVVHKGKEPCKACGVIPGGRHHLYCPHEICPRCKGKFASCGCF